MWKGGDKLDPDYAVKNFNLLNIQQVRTDRILDKLMYIKGKKFKEGEENKLLMDIKFRKENNIELTIPLTWKKYLKENTRLLKDKFKLAKAKAQGKKNGDKKK